MNVPAKYNVIKTTFVLMNVIIYWSMVNGR